MRLQHSKGPWEGPDCSPFHPHRLHRERGPASFLQKPCTPNVPQGFSLLSGREGRVPSTV